MIRCYRRLTLHNGGVRVVLCCMRTDDHWTDHCSYKDGYRIYWQRAEERRELDASSPAQDRELRYDGRVRSG